jgi:hypothetical protein
MQPTWHEITPSVALAWEDGLANLCLEDRELRRTLVLDPEDARRLARHLRGKNNGYARGDLHVAFPGSDRVLLDATGSGKLVRVALSQSEAEQLAQLLERPLV